jgi:uncharacterized protein (TIGR03000 family)
MRLFRVAALAAGLVWLSGASAQPPAAQPPAAQPPAKAKVKSIIKVTVPNEKAELMIEKETMKTTGLTREFETPELEPGTKWDYTFTLKFAPNNYTTITRVKTVTFAAGDTVAVDLTQAQPDDKAVIRFVPTPKDVADAMAKLAKVGKDDVVIDLGCGDGALVLAGIRAGAKKGIGVDIDPKRVEEAKAAAKEAGVADKTEFREGDALAITAKDLADVTVVMMYMSDELGAIIKPKLLAAAKPGTRIVSHRFLIGDWKPDQTKEMTGEDGETYKLHVWTVTQAAKDAAAKEPKKDEPKKEDKKDEKKADPGKDAPKKDK